KWVPSREPGLMCSNIRNFLPLEANRRNLDDRSILLSRRRSGCLLSIVSFLPSLLHSSLGSMAQQTLIYRQISPNTLDKRTHLANFESGPSFLVNRSLWSTNTLLSLDY